MKQIFAEEYQRNLGFEGTVQSVAESNLACSLDPIKEVGQKKLLVA